MAPTKEIMDVCWNCGGDPSDNWFDRSLCACDMMHTCCSNCGASLDYCPFDEVVE